MKEIDITVSVKIFYFRLVRDMRYFYQVLITKLEIICYGEEFGIGVMLMVIFGDGGQF
jgi:hypothetical protein